jgi:hypothetical protein
MTSGGALTRPPPAPGLPSQPFGARAPGRGWPSPRRKEPVARAREARYAAGEFVAPKSKAGVRTVPITERLALLLADHRVLTDHRDGSCSLVATASGR